MCAEIVQCRTALSPSRLPGLDWALNPYRGCRHACAYCYAQDVTHFRTDIPWGAVVEVKANIARVLRRELARRRYDGVCGIGTVTDPYQPAEREYQLTRGCLSELKRKDIRISILTKSDLVLRDLDSLVHWSGAEVGMTVSCIDDRIASILEPGAPPPSVRMDALSRLVAEGIDVYMMLAPVIPGISDSEDLLVRAVDAASAAGVGRIMWDGFNPRPLAIDRVSKVSSLHDLGMDVSARWNHQDAVRAILSRECADRGVGLLDAF
ncbi:MAG TPA: radical SAM protein [Thermoplasmata archaeon]|nr:radical SAM protein [Thermoplasmata archaeon]